jgi:hypothetical protein
MQSLPLKSQRDQNPATMALELLARDCGIASDRKKEEALPDSADGKRRKRCNYDLFAIYQSATSSPDDSFDFPSIEWVSDDEEDCEILRVVGGDEPCLPLSPARFLQDHSKRQKSSQSCPEPTAPLVRCCAISKDLCSLSEGNFSQTPPTDFLMNLLDQLNADFDQVSCENSFPASPSRRRLQKSCGKTNRVGLG